ncbi:hypothetical protein BC332_24387 [Capsicum chinense]|nr:hypothetical protein BC332_24387 [Capsicum chinense]
MLLIATLYLATCSFQVIQRDMAYASVASFMRTMGLVLASKSPMKSLISDHIKEFLAVHEKVSFLEVFLKDFEKNNTSGKMTDLEVQIKELATIVEHIIQLRLTEIVTTDDEMQKQRIHERLCDSIKQVTEEFDRVQKESSKFQDKGKQGPKEFWFKIQIHHPNSWMGGIGKTTLEKEVYNDASIRIHFDVHSWASVSQQHNVKEILLSLLRCTKGDKFYLYSEAGLEDMLQKSLKGKRYLIVLDEMWDSEAWYAVRLCFPIENNGSRIFLTTRNNEVACFAGIGSLSLQMDLMGPDETWRLFESIAFSNEVLPSEFKITGKQIFDKCHWLPRTIDVVAGLLKSKKTIEYWENISKDVKSITNDPDKQCLDVLGLSYNHLTSDLKACLLYF